MAKGHKQIERKVAEYLYCQPDEHGSRRDWKDLHDLSTFGHRPGNREEWVRWIIEVKSHKWRSGPSSLWGLLDGALNQCIHAMSEEGFLVGDMPARSWDSPQPHPWLRHYPVAIYWPTYCPSDGSALAYLELPEFGSRVIIPISEFRLFYVAEPSEQDYEKIKKLLPRV